MLTVAVLSLSDELINALLVLSLLPGLFSSQLACELLVLSESRSRQAGLVRRLVDRALLQYNGTRQMYSMHPVVREVGGSRGRRVHCIWLHACCLCHAAAG